MKIAVAGGTGVLGRHIVEACREAGHSVSILSRRTGSDLTSGEGLDAALDGVEVIIDATNTASQAKRQATTFFTTVTHNLQRAGARAGATHLITVSIVNIDRVPSGYYQAKLAQEAAARQGPLPASIVRATQFHEFPVQIIDRFRLGQIAFMPRMRVQTVAARALGNLIAELAAHPSAETSINVAGPQPADLVDLARAVIVRRDDKLHLVPVPIPGRAGRAMRAGALLPPGDARLVGPTFEEWLGGDDVLAVGR